MANAQNDNPRSDSVLREAEEKRRPVRLQVATLMDGGREAILEHAGQDYHLRITANGKLILTK